MNAQHYLNFTGMSAAVALAIGTLGAGQAYAQQYDVATIQTYDLGKLAGHAERRQPVAPIAARPNGNAYIQWAHQTDWNGGHRGNANSRVFVTEVNATGGVVGSDIEIGRSQPGGLAATENSFGYYLWDGDKLTFKVHNGGETLVMDHRDKGPTHNDPRPTTFRRGFRPDHPSVYSPLKGAYAFAVPWLPFMNDRGGIAYGNNAFGTAFTTANNYQPSGEQSRDPNDLTKPGPAWTNPNDSHNGDAYVFFNGNGSAPPTWRSKG